MKPIKICEANYDRINAALGQAYSRNTAHSHTAWELSVMTVRADGKLHGWLGTKERLPGAVLLSVSGDRVSPRYKSAQRATKVIMQRRATGWYLVSVWPASVFAEGGFEQLYLTAEQDEAAVERFQSQYFAPTPTGESLLNRVIRLVGD